MLNKNTARAVCLDDVDPLLPNELSSPCLKLSEEMSSIPIAFAIYSALPISTIIRLINEANGSIIENSSGDLIGNRADIAAMALNLLIRHEIEK